MNIQKNGTNALPTKRSPEIKVLSPLDELRKTQLEQRFIAAKSDSDKGAIEQEIKAIQHMNACCGSSDRAVAALITDLKRRGMLDDTLIVWGGEFGRTPMSQKGSGRDHHIKGFSMFLADIFMTRRARVPILHSLVFGNRRISLRPTASPRTLS